GAGLHGAHLGGRLQWTVGGRVLQCGDEDPGHVLDVDAVADLLAVAVHLDGVAGQGAAGEGGQDLADLGGSIGGGNALAGTVGVDRPDRGDAGAPVGVVHPGVVLGARLGDRVAAGGVVAHPGVADARVHHGQLVLRR